MKQIKPIETEYNGYRFRSRLEARWAVFFDAAGIPYEYEPEGFELKDGTKYLPDFYLPWFKCYVEIKPLHMSKKDEEDARKKLYDLFNEHGDCCTMLCKGQPMDRQMSISCFEQDDSGGGWMGWQDAYFVMGGWYYNRDPYGKLVDDVGCWGFHYINLCIGEKEDRWRAYTTANWDSIPSHEPFCDLEDKENADYLDWAAKKARQAHFEFCETPKP